MSVQSEGSGASSRHVFVSHRSEAECLFFKELAQGAIVYSGGQFRVKRWLPDFLVVEPGAAGYILRLVEVEPTLSVALEAGRKYIPESCREIIESFRRYVRDTRLQCGKVFDTQRESELAKLEGELLSRRLEVRTACGLRDKPGYLEDLRLADQGASVVIGSGEEPLPSVIASIGSTQGLARQGASCLFRAVLSLDAVVLKEDRSDAVQKAWCTRRARYLRCELVKTGDQGTAFATLLTADKFRGCVVDLNELVRDLGRRWKRVGFSCDSKVVETWIRGAMEVVGASHYSERIQILLDKVRGLVQERPLSLAV